MQNSFDIMKIDSDDSLLWVEAAESFDAAKDRVLEFMYGSPGEYIVFDQETKQLLALFSPRPEWSPLDSDLASVEETLIPADVPTFEEPFESPYFQTVPSVVM